MSSDDDSDRPGLGRACLAIDEDYEDYDMDLPPTSGSEYLRRVQWEAKQCPDVVVANIKQSQFDGKKTVKVICGTGCLPAPEGYSPSLSWQRNQVANFSEVRQALSRRRIDLKNNRKKWQPVKLPKIDDELGWCRFCFGNRMVKYLATKKPSGSTEPMDEDQSSHDVGRDGVQPFNSIVLSMPQPVVEQVLDYHIKWFEMEGFSIEQGRWFYALLSCLEKPLAPETCSSIRTLARICSNLRACLESREDAYLVHLNLLICLVACYFDQTDLADR